LHSAKIAQLFLNSITFIVSCTLCCDMAQQWLQNNSKSQNDCWSSFKFFRLRMLCVLR